VHRARPFLIRIAAVAAVAAIVSGGGAMLRSRRADDIQTRTPTVNGQPAAVRPRVHLSRPSAAASAGQDLFSAAFERGLAAYNADDAEAALDAFEEAVRLAPENSEARINLGMVYLRLQRPTDGLRELEIGARLEREGTATGTDEQPVRRKGTDTIRE
jgi:tetratricopeptide (TPR) repeat protein